MTCWFVVLWSLEIEHSAKRNGPLMIVLWKILTSTWIIWGQALRQAQWTRAWWYFEIKEYFDHLRSSTPSAQWTLVWWSTLVFNEYFDLLKSSTLSSAMDPRWWSHQVLYIEGSLPVSCGSAWSTWSSYYGLGASLEILRVSHLLSVVRHDLGRKNYSRIDLHLLCKLIPCITATARIWLLWRIVWSVWR
jgi:hypothetical protein